MITGGFSSKRLARVRDVLARHVDAGYVPGAVAVVARHGEVHIEATGNLAFAGAGSRTPMAADTICRTGSMTKPIADALNALQSDEPAPPPDEWIRRLGALPLVYQPGERWMYHTAASVTGVLIARATGMSFGDVLRERICDPLGARAGRAADPLRLLDGRLPGHRRLTAAPETASQ
jgi:CubicO group peptidase (beta-lactamase class C family)